MFGTVYAAGATFGYSKPDLDAMPVWEVAVRLGIAEGSDGYPMRSGKVATHAEVAAQEEAIEDRKKGQARHGRMDPRKVRPTVRNGREVDTGRLFTGEAAR